MLVLREDVGAFSFISLQSINVESTKAVVYLNLRHGVPVEVSPVRMYSIPPARRSDRVSVEVVLPWFTVG